MRQMFSLSWLTMTVLFLVLVFSSSSSYAVVPVRPVITCLPVTGTPPVIDGTKSSGEWPSTPQLTLSSPTYPIDTNFYCVNDLTNLYILVDALGDLTDDSTSSPCTSSNEFYCDECLLVFGVGTNTYLAEVWGKAGNIIGSNPDPLAPLQAAIGLGSGNRFYEWKIPLSAINASPGQLIDFSSPKLLKGAGSGDFLFASMPFDGATTNDNEWPIGVDPDDKATWGLLQLDPATSSVPTLNEWGMIIFMVVAALGSIYFLRRRQRAG